MTRQLGIFLLWWLGWRVESVIADALQFTVASWEGVTAGVPMQVTWTGQTGEIRMLMNSGTPEQPGNIIWMRNQTYPDYWWTPFIQIGYPLNTTWWLAIVASDTTEAFSPVFTIGNGTGSESPVGSVVDTKTYSGSVSFTVDGLGITTTSYATTISGGGSSATTTPSISSTGTSVTNSATNTAEFKSGTTSILAPTNINASSTNSKTANPQTTSSSVAIPVAASGGLSTTAKVGIGIGIFLGGGLIIITAALAFFWRRRYTIAIKRKSGNIIPAGTRGKDGNGGTEGMENTDIQDETAHWRGWKAELDATGAPSRNMKGFGTRWLSWTARRGRRNLVELDGGREVGELDGDISEVGKSKRSELDGGGTVRHELSG